MEEVVRADFLQLLSSTKAKVDFHISFEEKAVVIKHLGKKEILTAVQKAGYKFSTKDPMNSLQVQLYTKFKRDKDGKFHV